MTEIDLITATGIAVQAGFLTALIKQCFAGILPQPGTPKYQLIVPTIAGICCILLSLSAIPLYGIGWGTAITNGLAAIPLTISGHEVVGKQAHYALFPKDAKEKNVSEKKSESELH